jgi:hypothetical protein
LERTERLRLWRRRHACLTCNPCGGPDDPPNITRAGFKVKLDKDGPRH